MKIVLDGCIEGLKTRQDGSVVLSFATQELEPDTAGRLFQFRNKYVKSLFSDNGITKLEEELTDAAEIADGRKSKTPSQRMRNVLFLVHTSNGGTKDDFNKFYASEMERIIEHYKQKIG